MRHVFHELKRTKKQKEPHAKIAKVAKAGKGESDSCNALGGSCQFVKFVSILRLCSGGVGCAGGRPRV